jgi:hypothetical protein
MPDYGFLLGAKPVELPNPLELATKGASLAGLMQNVDLGALTLEQKRQMMALYQDPRYLTMLSSMVGGGAPGGQGGGAPGSPDLSVLGSYPAAAEGALQNILKMRVEGAAATENLARAANYNQDVRDKRLAKVADAAYEVAQNPTLPSITSLVHAHEFAGLQPGDFGNAPTTLDPAAWQKWAGQVYGSLSDAKIRAQTAKDLAETAVIQPKLAVSQQEANTGQAKLALDMAKFYKGEPFQDPDSKQWFLRVPNANGAGFTIKPVPMGPNDQGTTPSAAPPAAPSGTVVAQLPKGFTPNMSDQQIATALDAARAAGKTSFSATGTDINGKPVTITVPVTAAADISQNTSTPAAPAKTGPDYREKELVTSSKPQMEHMIAQAQSAATMKEMLLDMRKQEAAGIFSGGIAGQQFFRKLANVLSPFLSQEQMQKLANTQAWQAGTGQVVAQAVSQFAGSRVAAREIPFFEGIKPELLQTAQGRAEIYQHLYNVSDRLQQQAEQAGAHMANPANTAGLATFRPDFKDRPLPPIQLDQKPNPKTWKGGDIIDDATGQRQRVVNGAWTNVGSALSDQVPQ